MPRIEVKDWSPLAEAERSVSLDVTHDHGRVVVEYSPRAQVLERTGFADVVTRAIGPACGRGALRTPEDVVEDLAAQLWKAVSPRHLMVTASFSPHNGVTTTVVVQRGAHP